MAMPPPAALRPPTPPAASPPDADGRPITSADLEGLTNGISALNSVRRPPPIYGSWAGAVAPPLQVIGGPGRLSDAMDTASHVLSRADPFPTSDPSRARPAQTRRHRLRLALRADNLRPSRSRHPPRRLPTYRFCTPALRHRAHTATRQPAVESAGNRCQHANLPRFVRHHVGGISERDPR